MSTTSGPAVSQLGYIGVGTREPDAWRPLMNDVLGLQLSDELADGSLRFRADSHLYRVAIHPDPLDDLLYLGWQARGPDELAEFANILSNDGVEIEEGTSEEALVKGVEGFIRFSDPDGLLNEVFFGPTVCSEPLLPGRPSQGFRAEELGLGHVVIGTGDVATAAAFYQAALGLKLSDHGSATLTFLRCNPRHHSIAFKPVETLTGRKRLVHAMIEMLTLDDVGRALDLCLQHDIPVATTIGKHVNDYAVSFYLRTPGDLEIECACQGRLVDEDTWEVHRYRSREVWGHHPIDKFIAELRKQGS